jgi:hypothetical protein
MAEPDKIPPIPRSFLQDVPVTTVNVGLALVSRRSSAIADFWRSCVEVRQPTDLVALQFSYWSQMMDDYQEALQEGFSQLTPESADKSAPPQAVARSA